MVGSGGDLDAKLGLVVGGEGEVFDGQPWLLVKAFAAKPVTFIDPPGKVEKPAA